jgi:hypothetical protein
MTSPAQDRKRRRLRLVAVALHDALEDIDDDGHGLFKFCGSSAEPSFHSSAYFESIQRIPIGSSA